MPHRQKVGLQRWLKGEMVVYEECQKQFVSPGRKAEDGLNVLTDIHQAVLAIARPAVEMACVTIPSTLKGIISQSGSTAIPLLCRPLQRQCMYATPLAARVQTALPVRLDHCLVLSVSLVRRILTLDDVAFLVENHCVNEKVFERGSLVRGLLVVEMMFQCQEEKGRVAARSRTGTGTGTGPLAHRCPASS